MPENKLVVSDFTEHPAVVETLRILKEKFSAENPLVVSDVLDDSGHQYVHLVQKGGGVLGVALVGYTYVLEMMGIRFMKQAGTSAGAINTALLTAIGTKQDMKSPTVLQAVCDLEFFDLVDGSPFARWLIKRVITDADFKKKLKTGLIFLTLWSVLLIVADIVLNGFQHIRPQLVGLRNLSFALSIITVAALAIVVTYAAVFLIRLKNSGYGINRGDFFYKWIQNLFEENGVRKVSDLKRKASAPVPGLRLRREHSEQLNGLVGSVAFITSELSSKNKIQFPEMCDLFRKKDDEDSLSPAGFVRASMAIPLFFRSYFIVDIPCDDDQIRKAWKDRFDENDPPSVARFVDGGILSNFPINLFYNPMVTVPRLPVFGIDLDDSSPGDKTRSATAWTFGGYLGRIFTTIQNYSDKEFLLKNKVYGKGVGKIKLEGYNWLNFFLPPKKKIELFVIGANAAKDFLLSFDWEAYKRERAGMQSELMSGINES